MRVIVHPGAHHTDDDRLLKCLLRNTSDFANRGVAVPGPSTYRTLLKQSFLAMENADASPQARDVLVDAILDDATADRLILSNSHFFGSGRYALVEGELYPYAAQRMQQFTQLFDSDQVELFIGLRNPASFLPALLRKASAEKLNHVLGGRDPRDLRWSEMLGLVRAALPDLPITVWCNEDTPLIWAQIIRDMAGLEVDQKIVGGFDLLSDLMSKDGMKRFRAYLKDHPTMTETQKRRVIAAFLDKFALENALEEELDLPGWTEPLVNEMSDIYDHDLMVIQQMPGVRVIEP
ncbi:MAG: hypothetical protein AB8B51_18725 [Sedimentitalea sp.]